MPSTPPIFTLFQQGGDFHLICSGSRLSASFAHFSIAKENVMRFRFLMTVAAAAFIGLAAIVPAQERPERRGPGGPPGGFGGGGGMMMMGGGGSFINRLFLLRLPLVQKELELVDEQLTAIQKLQEEMGRGRGPGGPGGPGGGDEQRGRGRGRPEGKADGNKSGNGAAFQRAVPADWYFVQAQEQDQQRFQRRPGGGQPPTEEERRQFEQLRLERARQEKAKLAEILLPHQMKRLTEIFVQVTGVGALQDEDIAKELGITDAQKGAITSVRQANGEALQTLGRELAAAGGGEADRDANRAKVAELRKAGDAKVLELLSAEQKAKWEELKGKPFDLPEEALRSAFGGFGGRGPGGPGGRGPGGPGDGKRGPREGNNPNS
jgi:hypothetical protein